MIAASISTVPARVSAEPQPALKAGSSSSTRTAASTASSAEAPRSNAAAASASARAEPGAGGGHAARLGAGDGAGAAVDEQGRVHRGRPQRRAREPGAEASARLALISARRWSTHARERSGSAGVFTQ